MLDSFIILSFNKLSVTRNCVSAVVRGTRFEGETELIIVDNGSADGSVEWMKSELTDLCRLHGIRLRLILNDRNVGCCTARNQALAVAVGEYITFLDNDVEPATSDWLSALRSRMLTLPKTGMVGGLLLYPPQAADREVNSLTRPPANSPTRELVNSQTIQCAGVGISRRGHVCFRGRGEPVGADKYALAREVQCLISACMMIRRSLYDEYGGFDEIFNPVQFEDFDICYRYREHGWQAWYEPLARMYHHESTTTAGTPSIRNAAVVVRNGLKFQKRWRHMFENEDGPPEDECRWKHHLTE